MDSFGIVEAGKLYRGRQPSPDQWDRLAEMGIGTVISLRSEESEPNVVGYERQVCRQAGWQFIVIPVTSELPEDSQVEQFLHAVRKSDKPVYVHCQYGQQRTGLMAAAYRVAQQGWSPKKALAEMERFGAKSSPGKRQRILELLQRVEEQSVGRAT